MTPRLNDRVHFVTARDRVPECRAATVARVHVHSVDLSVLMPTSIGYLGVPHDPTGQEGTWHWAHECTRKGA